jgi:hypothetical protein
VVRATFDFNKGTVRGPDGTLYEAVPTQLPVKVGQFEVFTSPNQILVYVDAGEVFSGDPRDLPERDDNYPFDIYYIEFEISIRDDEKPEEIADGQLRRLQILLRLYQEGLVWVRRYGLFEKSDKGLRRLFQLWQHTPQLPEPDFWNRLDDYSIDDTKLKEIDEFVRRHWKRIQSPNKQIAIALERFSFSFDRHSPSDRLVDLAVACEAAFGDQQGAHSYKLAVRMSRLFPKEMQKKVFDTVQDIYGTRSGLVHGGKSVTKTDRSQIVEYEAMLRTALKRILEVHESEGRWVIGKDWDESLWS